MHDPFLHAWIRFPVLQGKICLITQYEAVLGKIRSASERDLFRDDVVLHIKCIFSWARHGHHGKSKALEGRRACVSVDQDASS
jgi:hypothetical protein